jgi:hypothetical protein
MTRSVAWGQAVLHAKLRRTFLHHSLDQKFSCIASTTPRTRNFRVGLPLPRGKRGITFRPSRVTAIAEEVTLDRCVQRLCKRLVMKSLHHRKRQDSLPNKMKDCVPSFVHESESCQSGRYEHYRSGQHSRYRRYPAIILPTGRRVYCWLIAPLRH